MLATALSVATDGSRVPRTLHVGQVEPTASPGQPGIAQVVVDDGQGLIGEVRVDVVGPQRPGFEEVLVRVDDGAHRDQCNCRAPAVSWSPTAGLAWARPRLRSSRPRRTDDRAGDRALARLSAG